MNKVGVRTAVGIAMYGLLLTAPLSASAASMDYLDAYYIPDSTLEIETDGGSVESEEGDGFGVKLAAMLGENVFLAGEYQSTDNENIGGSGGNATVDTKRIGLGYNTSLPIYVLLEYINHEVEVDGGVSSGSLLSDSGFGAHIGLKFEVMDYVTLEARGGYLDIGDSDGFEYLAGIGLNLDKNFGLFVDYRVTDVDVENNALVPPEFTLTSQDLRTGFRFRF